MSLNKPKYITPLIEDCLAKKQQAQLELYLMYYKAMYNTALRIVKDQAWAEDIMQESFLSAFQKLDQFSGLVTFGAWLKKIVINKSLVAYKKQKKEAHTSIENLEYKMEVVLELEDSDKAALNKKKARLIILAIESLNENYRLSLSLHLLEGLTHEEVSEVLGISNANCRTTFSRAKEQLRKKLEEDPIWKNK
ncbi:MAG: RNA polymerase sigma factor (sigma-70 family) [Arcticibacterium sp.]